MSGNQLQSNRNPYNRKGNTTSQSQAPNSNRSAVFDGNQHPFSNSNVPLYHPTNAQFTPMTQQSDKYYGNMSPYGPNLNNPVPNNLKPSFPTYGDFGTAFNPQPTVQFNGIQPKAMFNNHGFVNRGDLLYNNLYNIIQNEEIREYSIMIDSKDRNIEVYPNPFKYKVTFNPIPTTRERDDNGKLIIHETPNPVIDQELVNVRYIVLEDVILPFYTHIKTVDEMIDDEIVKVPKVDITQNLTDYLYVVLRIDEYTDVNTRSTNEVLSESFATIYYDYATNRTHYAGCNNNGIKIFQPDQLGTIDSLRIKFMNPYGEELSVNNLAKNVASNFKCTCDSDEVSDRNCYRHNLNHPLNPIFQHHLQFRVGIVETRLNKKVFS